MGYVMSTIVLNGSPKLSTENSNTHLFCETFVGGMKNPYEIRRIADGNYHELAQYIRGFDTVILIMPLYVHAMPGSVKKFLETLEPVESGKKIGFIIQAGFPESAQSKFVTAYLERFSARLGYEYLGTVAKGECAGVSYFPKMFKKTIQMFRELGKRYEQTGGFDAEIAAQMAKPYELSKRQVRILKIANSLGIDNFFWHQKLKENGAMDKRMDEPFA